MATLRERPYVQFNFLVDMSSAYKVLQAADTGRFKLTLVPTECIKQS